MKITRLTEVTIQKDCLLNKIVKIPNIKEHRERFQDWFAVVNIKGNPKNRQEACTLEFWISNNWCSLREVKFFYDIRIAFHQECSKTITDPHCCFPKQISQRLPQACALSYELGTLLVLKNVIAN